MDKKRHPTDTGRQDMVETDNDDPKWHRDIFVLLDEVREDVRRRAQLSANAVSQRMSSQLPFGTICVITIAPGEKLKLTKPGAASAWKTKGSVHGKETVSRYLDANADISAPAPGTIELMAKWRITDHQWKERMRRLERSADHVPEGWETSLIQLDANDCIEVRGRGGFSCKWSDLAWPGQKVPLMNGDNAPVSLDAPDGAMIVAPEFFISVENRRKIRSTAAKDFSREFHDFAKFLIGMKWDGAGG